MRCELSNPSNKQVEAAYREADLARAVMEYLSEHPQAMDTLEGIAEWWVKRQAIRLDVEALAKVLRQLKEKGILEEIGSGAYARYRLKR